MNCHITTWSWHTNQILAIDNGTIVVIGPENNWEVTSVERMESWGALLSPDGRFISDDNSNLLDRASDSVSQSFTRILAWHPTDDRFVSDLAGGIGISSIVEPGEPLISEPVSHRPIQSWSWNPTRALIAANMRSNEIRVMHAETLQPYWHAIQLPDQKSVTFSAAGQITDGDREVVNKYIRYYIETDDGRIETLTPDEFERRIGKSIELGGTFTFQGKPAEQSQSDRKEIK